MSLLVLRGPGGAGKSTVSKKLVEHLRETRKVGLIEADSFYWDIAGRDPNPDIMYEGLRRLADLYLSKNYDFVIEGILTAKDKFGIPRINDLVRTAQTYDTKTGFFHLYASIDLLRERVKTKFTKNGWNFDEKAFQGWYNNSLKSILPNEIRIDTQEKSPDEIVSEIIKYI